MQRIKSSRYAQAGHLDQCESDALHYSGEKCQEQEQRPRLKIVYESKYLKRKCDAITAEDDWFPASNALNNITHTRRAKYHYNRKDSKNNPNHNLINLSLNQNNRHKRRNNTVAANR